MELSGLEEEGQGEFLKRQVSIVSFGIGGREASQTT